MGVGGCGNGCKWGISPIPFSNTHTQHTRTHTHAHTHTHTHTQQPPLCLMGPRSSSSSSSSSNNNNKRPANGADLSGPHSALTCTPWWVNKGWLFITVLRV